MYLLALDPLQLALQVDSSHVHDDDDQHDNNEDDDNDDREQLLVKFMPKNPFKGAYFDHNCAYQKL